MDKYRALVFGGGGARGALQVGAVRALCEQGYQPDLVIGTSAGAINAAYVALHGFTLQSIKSLAAAWQRAGETELLPANYIRQTLQAMLRASPASPASRLREFFVANGMTADLTFADFRHPRLIIVSSDLNTGQPVLHGLAPEDNMLEALLASTALPPWVMPRKAKGHELMDGAVVSSLPIEPAMQAGATEIVALDLMDARDPFGEAQGFGILANKMAYAVEQRQVDLELKLAEARGVPVFYIDLTAEQLVAIWDFQHTQQLVARGYEQTCAALDRRGIGAGAPPIW